MWPKLKYWPLMILGACLLGGALASKAEFTSVSHRLTPSAVNQGGEDNASSDSHIVHTSAGEVGISTFTSDSHILQTGLMNLIAFPGSVTDFSATTLSSSSINLSWSAPGYDGAEGQLQEGTSYYLQHSTSIDTAWNYADALTVISTKDVTYTDPQGSSALDLWPNTTYFFRLWTKDAEGNISDLSNGATAVTLAQVPQNAAQPFTNVEVSSVTFNWTALLTTPSSASARGYQLDVSTSDDFTGLSDITVSTESATANTLTVDSLMSNTTYYFRVGSWNWLKEVNFGTTASTVTKESSDPTPPYPVTNLSASTASATTVFLSWLAPTDPTNNPLSGTYAIQYATTTDVLWSTANAQVSFATSSVNPGDLQGRLITGLVPNTTHYFYLWTSDSKPNWSSISNGATVATLANPVSDVSLLSIATGSASFTWTALPEEPSSSTANGYLVEASSTNFGAISAGGINLSSTVAGVVLNTVTISDLVPNATYYFRVASLNRNNCPNFVSAGSSVTLSNQATRLSNDFVAVTSYSITSQWVPLPETPPSATSEGYRLELSSTNFGSSGTVYSTSTSNVNLSALARSGLSSNTTYYLRLGSLNWIDVPNYINLSATSTLANIPSNFTLTNMSNSSATFSWTVPPEGASGFTLEASTNFKGSGIVLSSTTYSTTATSLVVKDLLSNTTYAFRVGSLNWLRAPHYAAYITTATLANPPQRLASDFLTT
ncbi:MAG: fibronectin type III domain-containing protein, partial [Elusimicrobia bacterium]|nr:fibronectin type III domain-containing protein [Candidatus Obscuribacterium magneticum]